MGVTFSDRLARMGYVRARRLILLTGLLVLAAVALVTWVRGVDTVEVAATILFLPVFVAFVWKGVAGGLVGAVGAIAAYAALRAPAIDAIGAGEFTGLLLSRASAYLIFGLVGGWSTQVLEGSLEKLELYDEIDDETGLYNARHLLNQLDLETARARRYQTLFSVVELPIPGEALARLRPRERRSVLTGLGRVIADSVRNVDHVVHLRDGGTHHLVAVLPETAGEGAAVFCSRFADRVREHLAERGVVVPAAEATALTVPGDEAALEALRARVRDVDARQHR